MIWRVEKGDVLGWAPLDTGPTYMAFTNFLSVLGTLVTELHCATAYNLFLLTTMLCWEQRTSW